MKRLILSSTLFFCLEGLSAVTAAPSVAADRSGGYALGTREYESAAVVEFIVPRMDEDVPQQEQIEAGLKFAERQREGICSDVNLRKAIQELVPGAVGDRADFFDQVKKGLKVENIRGTDLLKITVRSGDKRFSRDLANLLAKRYLNDHKPKGSDKGPIIHQKAVIGVPVEGKKQEVEQGAP